MIKLKKGMAHRGRPFFRSNAPRLPRQPLKVLTEVVDGHVDLVGGEAFAGHDFFGAELVSQIQEEAPFALILEFVEVVLMNRHPVTQKLTGWKKEFRVSAVLYTDYELHSRHQTADPRHHPRPRTARYGRRHRLPQPLDLLPSRLLRPPQRVRRTRAALH